MEVDHGMECIAADTGSNLAFAAFLGSMYLIAAAYVLALNLGYLRP